jgi:hypothetical protein
MTDQPETRWNGEPCQARRVTAIVADDGRFPQYWARHLVGTRRKAVEVTYGDSTFYLDDEDGSGWDKVTHGGSPHWGHSSLTIEPDSIRPCVEATVERVRALRDRWVKAGPPPLGTPLARWWDARLIELNTALDEPKKDA